MTYGVNDSTDAGDDSAEGGGDSAEGGDDGSVDKEQTDMLADSTWNTRKLMKFARCFLCFIKSAWGIFFLFFIFLF